MRRIILAMAIVIGYQQYKIHDLYELHEDAGEYIDNVADQLGGCGDGYDSCGEEVTYLRADVDALREVSR